ncbi:MAG: EamA family transporter RarD [Parvularcula sp.]
MTDQEHSEQVRLGVLSATLAYTIWGFFPIYFILLRGVGADEVLAHRIIWAVPFGALIIWARRQWPDVRKGLGDRSMLTALAASACIIAANWLIYIYAVQHQRTMEASLGYYINPLIYVAVGMVFLGERLRRAQAIAVVLATIGVLILTVYGGQFPLISLVLACSFTAYGYIRKRANIGGMPGLFIETLLLAPFALGYGIYLTMSRDTAFETGGPGMVGLLVLAGPVTVTPLLFFAIAARRLTLATLGFLQFIGPSIQFLVALADGEPFSHARQICFALIWLAAAIFAADAWRSRPKIEAQINPGKG